MAARHWVNGGVDSLWSTIGNWSLTAGGAGGQTVPSASDDVFFNSGTGDVNCTVNTSARVAKSLTFNGYTATFQQDQQLSVSGSITLTTTAFTWSGTSTNKLRMIAAGTWTTNGKTIPQDIEIGGTTTFTCTLADALTGSGALLLSNTTSTIFSGAFAISISGNATVQGSQTITVSDAINIIGTTTIADANVVNAGGASIWRTGGLTVTGALTGTISLQFNGTGTWQGAAACSVNVQINTSGTVTLSGTVLFAASGTPTLQYTAGTLIVTSSTLSIASSCSLSGDTGVALVLNNVLLTAALTLTINTTVLSILGTLTLPNAAVTFAGGFGFTVDTLTNTTITATRVYTFTTLLTYTVLSSIFMVSAAAQTVRFTFTSSSGTTRALLVIAPGATIDVGFTDPTRIDASGGQPIYTYRGVITDSPNWFNTVPSVTQPTYEMLV